jgi:hypothetical protein
MSTHEDDNLSGDSAQLLAASRQILNHPHCDTYLAAAEKELLLTAICASQNTEYAFVALRHAMIAATGEAPDYDLLVDSIIDSVEYIAPRYKLASGSEMLLQYFDYLQYQYQNQFTPDHINRDSFADYAKRLVGDKHYALVADFQARVSSNLFRDARKIARKIPHLEEKIV